MTVVPSRALHVAAAALLAGVWLATPPSSLAQDKPAADAAADAAAKPAEAVETAPWMYPQMLRVDGRNVQLHEPVISAHDSATGAVTLRCALAFTDAVGRQGFGHVDLKGTARPDLPSRLIRVDGMEVVAVSCVAASADDKAAIEGQLGAALPKHLLVRLEVLTARVGAFAGPASEPKLNSTAPVIYLRRKPAVLIHLDGEPVMIDIPNFPLQYVGNTASDLIHKPADDVWFLLLDGRWATAKKMEGPWSWLEGRLPVEMTQISIGHARGHIRQFIAGTTEYRKRGGDKKPDPAAPAPVLPPIPDVIISKEPAELVLLLGDPLFTLVSPEVKLMTVANTASDVIFHPKSGKFYLLISGRWFQSESLDGKWKPAYNVIPKEFKLIPRDHRMAHVLASVPGTPEAAEAAARAALPIVSTVKDQIRLDVRHTDKKVFSTPMADSTAKHCPSSEDDVFEIDGTFYACGRGVWFSNTSGTGKFKPVETQPKALRKFTAATGYYHDNFCRALGKSEGGLDFAVTSGYLGVFHHKGFVVYGTGWGGKGMLRNNNWYPLARTYGENRWFDAREGVFQPRSVNYDADGRPVASAWSPYTASYGRVSNYGDRYGQGGRRMLPFNRGKGVFNTAAARPDPYAPWSGYNVARSGISKKELPLGDRSKFPQTPSGDTLVAASDGKVFRMLDGEVQTWDGKGAWAAAPKAPADVRDALRSKEFVNAAEGLHATWAAKRRAPLPVNPEATGK